MSKVYHFFSRNGQAIRMMMRIMMMTKTIMTTRTTTSKTVSTTTIRSTLDLIGRENTSFLINIVKRSLLRLYRLLQVERRPYRAETDRQLACEMIPGKNDR